MPDELPEESEPISPAELIEKEARGLKWCLAHDTGVVYFDGPLCPVCQIIQEQREEAAKVFLEMTQNMEDN